MTARPLTVQPPQRLWYAVLATFDEAGLADEFVAWLKSGHLEAVKQGGADSAIVVRLDPDPSGRQRIMAQYTFPSRAIFDHYLTHHAPALRAEGQQRFPAARG